MLVGAGLVLTPTAPALGQDEAGLGIQLLDVPADQAANPRARLYIVDVLNPGATIRRRIRVSNLSDRAERVDVYPAAADVEDGWSVAEGRAGSQLTGWISVEPSRLRLPPHGAAEVTATIRVPGDTGGGERYAAVVAEGRARQAGDGVRIVSRVGIRVYLTVRGEQAPVRDFRIDTLTGGRDAEGAPFVVIGVDNTGDRAIDVSGQLELTDGPGSTSAGPFEVALPRTIGSGDRGELRVALDPRLPDGPWHAVAELSSGPVERSAAGRITFPSDAGEVGETVAASPVERQRRALIPATGGLLLLTLIAVLLLLPWRRRDQEDEEEPRPSASPEPAKVDLSRSRPGRRRP